MGIEVFERQAAEFGEEIVPQRADRPVGHQVRAQSGQPVEQTAYGHHGGDEEEGADQGRPVGRAALRHDQIDGPADELRRDQDPRIAQNSAEEHTGERPFVPPDHPQQTAEGVGFRF